VVRDTELCGICVREHQFVCLCVRVHCSACVIAGSLEFISYLRF